MHAWSFLGVIALALGSACAVAGGDVADAEIRLAVAASALSPTLGLLKTAKDTHGPSTLRRDSALHLDQIRPVSPGAAGCEECLRLGGRWVHLRMCLSCGHVGCCDSSQGKHATQHFRETGYALAQSAEPGESWRWCYIDLRQI